MTVLRPRSRMISVRLSEQEYSALHEMCVLAGARSVSDFVRERMRACLNGKNGDQGHIDYAPAIEAQVYFLNQKINELADRISSARLQSKP